MNFSYADLEMDADAAVPFAAQTLFADAMDEADIPLLTPGQDWLVVNGQGVAGPTPVRSDMVYDAAIYPVPACRRTRGYWLNVYPGSTIGQVTVLTIQALGATETIPVSCEGAVVQAPFGRNPIDGSYGHLVRVAARAGQNGWATVSAVLTPAYGGMAETVSIVLHLNTEATGAGYVPTTIRYVRVGGSDANDGLTPATAKRTLKGAVDGAPLSGATSSKNAIWVFDIGPGARDDHPWARVDGKDVGQAMPGVGRAFAYQWVVRGQGRDSTVLTVDPVSYNYDWTITGGTGRPPKIQGLTLDLKEVLQKRGGAWFDDCALTDDWGKNRPRVFGYPKGDDVLTGRFPSGFSPGACLRFRDSPTAPDVHPRWMMSNCDVVMGECGTIQQRLNCRLTISYDVVAVADSGNWAHQGDRARQFGNLDQALHSGDYLVVASVLQDDAYGGYTELTFDNGPIWATATAYTVEGGNTFLRVLDAADAAATTTQLGFPINCDGTRDFPYLGHRIRPNDLTAFPPGWGWDSVQKKVRIFGKIALSPGDKVQAYTVSHGDAGQFMQNYRPTARTRENYTFVDCLYEGHTWQPILPQGGTIAANGATGNGTLVDITGVSFTAAAGSTTVQFDGGTIPPWLQLYDWIGYNPTGAPKSAVLRCVTAIQPGTGEVTIHAPFPTVRVNSPVQCLKAIVGVYVVNSIYNKSGDSYIVGQLTPCLVDTAMICTTFAGRSTNDQTLWIRTSATDGSGFWDLRLIDSLFFSVTQIDPWPDPSGFLLDNCWTEVANNSLIPMPAANILNGRGTGLVMGYPDRTAPYQMEYVPSATMTKTLPSRIYWRRRSTGERIGAIL
ncbi:hypothetical protein [Sphingomonas pokkalii]|uniref:Uncharacterized protein n=1 Tax=Sphingomonas pokkalii TaxID=2175090 RepID=A0A2U0SDH2_9SPHN|nr:hypothetical protein [Sphingomonas pokkalii]PVX29432.1 hypothetical protein DD559_08985 [Sphingomonas pokkalii]